MSQRYSSVCVHADSVLTVDAKPATPGNMLRINFYRAQGPLSQHKAIAWQPTHQKTYHVPEAFGSLKLVE